MEDFVFYPMSKKPLPDNEDTSFSKTVIIYSEGLDTFEFGYFDFEQELWTHFGKNEILLKCWCYVPHPKNVIEEWQTLEPKGYNKPLYK